MIKTVREIMVDVLFEDVFMSTCLLKIVFKVVEKKKPNPVFQAAVRDLQSAPDSVASGQGQGQVAAPAEDQPVVVLQPAMFVTEVVIKQFGNVMWSGDQTIGSALDHALCLARSGGVITQAEIEKSYTKWTMCNKSLYEHRFQHLMTLAPRPRRPAQHSNQRESDGPYARPSALRRSAPFAEESVPNAAEE